jgi:TRAP-type C4-dicarboxylate transport system permease small subunit
MTLVVILQVVCRYVISASLTWSEEFARFSLVWITFLGAGMAFKRGAHMGLEAIVKTFSPKSQTVVKLLTLLVTMGFLSIVTLKGIELAFFNLDQHSPAMRLPMGVIYFAIPTGCLIMLIHVFEEIVALLPNRSDKQPGRSR